MICLVKKKSKAIYKVTGRMVVILVLFSAVICTLSYTLIKNLSKVSELNSELVDLEEKKIELIEEKEVLEADIKRMSDPIYIARYAREKYFYSKDGEIILRIDE